MTISSDLALVLSLAVLTDDRDPAEQKALERTAARLDKERNRFSASNHRFAWGMPRERCTRPGCVLGECPTCSIDREPDRHLLVPPFTMSARKEALTDERGWSVALRAVKR